MIQQLKEGEYTGQTLKSEESTSFKLSLTSNEPDSKTEKHYHDNDYITLMTEGKFFEKNYNTNSLISSWDIVFRPKMYTHENSFDSFGGTSFNIEFKSDWERDFDIKLKLPRSFKHYKSGAASSLYKLVYNFKNEYNEELAFELICDWIFQQNPEIHFQNHQPWINKVERIIEKETGVFHSLYDLSERVFVHPVYLARAFKEKTGLTIGEYQLKCKISNSIILLLKTTLSIGEISYRTGFYDDAHFIRSFKSIYKISPHRFRLAVKR